MTNIETTSTTDSATGGSTALADLGVLLAAEAGVAALWLLWVEVGGVELSVTSAGSTREVGIGAAVVTAALVTVAGIGLLWLLGRWATGLRTWTIVAGLVWAISFLGPLSATSLEAGLGLATLHLWVGAIAVFGLRRVHGAH